MKVPGPARVAPTLVTPRNKPLAAEADPQSGPTVVPGAYRVELTVGEATMGADFMVVKDARLAPTPDDYARQFASLKALQDKLSALNAAANRIRRIKRQARVLADGLSETQSDLAAQVTAANEALTAIERVLVDVEREPPRDVLRHPAGLNDTLVDLINTVAIADMAPTMQAAVSREIMASVDIQLGSLYALLGARWPRSTVWQRPAPSRVCGLTRENAERLDMRRGCLAQSRQVSWRNRHRLH